MARMKASPIRELMADRPGFRAWKALYMVESYLRRTDLITPGTYLSNTLSGDAKKYASGYYSRMMAILSVGVDAGVVVAVPSVGGSTAYTYWTISYPIEEGTS